MLLAPRLRKPEQRRDAWTAFATLFLLIGSHQMLETARDALFLDRLPPERLPIVYLLVAVLSLGLNRAQTRISASWERRRTLAFWLLAAALITLGLWLLLPLGAPTLYALYAWTGILTTLVLVPFWTLLGDLFTVTEAKRVYGMIGSGSILGAVLGSAGAVVVAGSLSAEWLLVVAAVGLTLTATLPLRLRPVAGAPAPDEDEQQGPWADFRVLLEKSYPRQVALLVAVAAISLTTGDYLFKSAAARAYADGELPTLQSLLGGAPVTLGSFFAEVNLGLNVLSLASQTILLPLLLRRVQVTTALSVLPIGLAAGGLLAALGSIGGALLVKAADGSLKHSVHKTGLELLFVPMAESMRARVRAVIDVVAQRGGQAMASLLILIFGAFVPPIAFAVALMVTSVAWLLTNGRLRLSYLDLFRRQLTDRRRLDAFPEVDVASLETLVATLDSEREGEVMAALDVLEREGRSRLVPALILHHPSEEVVARALDLFGRAGRSRVRGHVERLFEHPSPQVRTAAAAAGAALGIQGEAMARLRQDADPGVRAVGAVHCLVLDEDPRDLDAHLESLIADAALEGRVAIADALGHYDRPIGVSALLSLLQDPEPEVRSAAAAAIRRRPPDRDMTPALLPLLVHEASRRSAAAALVHMDDLQALEAALVAPGTASHIRCRLPKIMASSEDYEGAADRLSRRIGEIPDGRTRFEAVHALEQLLNKHPNLLIDQQTIQQGVEQGLRLGFRFLTLRRALERGAEEDERRRTPGLDLLLQALHDRAGNATGRVLRLLGLLFPQENFAGIRRGLDSDDDRRRSGSLELLDGLLRTPVKEALPVLIELGANNPNLDGAGPFLASNESGFIETLRVLLKERSPTVAALSAYYVGELRLKELRSEVAAVNIEAARTDRELALHRLDGDREEVYAG